MTSTLLWLTLLPGVPPELYIWHRSLFERAPTHRAAFEQWRQWFEEHQPQDPVLQGYRAAQLMMQAKYVWNPLDKYRSFQRGRRLLDGLIRANPDLPELRYLRFTLQQHGPRFLNYYHDLESDSTRLRAALPTLTDPDLALRIRAALEAHSRVETTH